MCLDDEELTDAYQSAPQGMPSVEDDLLAHALGQPSQELPLSNEEEEDHRKGSYHQARKLDRPVGEQAALHVHQPTGRVLSSLRLMNTNANAYSFHAKRA